MARKNTSKNAAAPAWYDLWYWMRPLGGGPARWCSITDSDDRSMLEAMAERQRQDGTRVKITDSPADHAGTLPSRRPGLTSANPRRSMIGVAIYL